MDNAAEDIASELIGAKAIELARRLQRIREVLLGRVEGSDLRGKDRGKSEDDQYDQTNQRQRVIAQPPEALQAIFLTACHERADR